jgi:hypothetical protein
LKIKGITVGKKNKRQAEPGYRKPRTAGEQQFWDRNRPDYRAWAVKKKLTLDEVSALAMGLDPKCVGEIPYERGQTPARFEATKAWFKDVEAEFRQEPRDLLGINVFAMDFHLRVDPKLSETAQYSSEGFLDQDKVVARLKGRIRSLQKVDEIRCRAIAHLVSERSGSPKKTRTSAISNAEKTNLKLFLALALAHLPDEARRQQLQRLRNGLSVTPLVETIVMVVKGARLNWSISDDTVSSRLKEAREKLLLPENQL